jgi:uncharacterized protein YkwD
MPFVRRRRARRSIALGLLLGLGSTATARPGLVQSINAVRAAGCEGRRGVAVALRPSRELDDAARRLARGDALAEGLAAAGYHAMQAVSVEVENAATDAVVAQSVARTACERLLDRSMTHVGITRTADEVWVILAAPFPSAALRDVQAVTRRLVALANAARARPRRCGDTSFGAARPLVVSAPLTQAARTHTLDMAAHGTVGHGGSDGSKPSDRVTRTGYHWRRVAENVATGMASPEEAMDGWLASPGHCANLMNPGLTETGVAYAVDPASAGGVYWTQVFAAPGR